MIIASPRIMYFALGMLALILITIHWTYGLPLILYIALKVKKKPKLATPSISGFVLMALYMMPAAILLYFDIAWGQWVHIIRGIIG